MTVSGVQGHPAAGTSARPWTVGAFASQAVYLVWLPLMFAMGYWIASVFGYEPGTAEPVGFGAMAANIVFALLVVPLPSWIGAGLAVTARRRGGGTAATVALVVCLLIGIGLTVISLPLNGV